MPESTASKNTAKSREKKAAHPGWLNLPNALSAFRLCLVPVFAAIYFSGAENARLYAFAVFLLAGITDIADGIIARRCHLVTSLGRLLDPLADKLMQLTALACITSDGLVPPFLLAIFAVKELSVLLGGATLYRMFSDVLPSNRLGKAAAVTFYVAVAAVLIIENLPKPVEVTLFGAAILLAVFALVIYLRNFIVKYKARGKND